MRNLNTKQAKQELSKLIFDLVTDKEFAERGWRKGASELDKKFGIFCQCSFDLNIIALYEEFGIAYYDEEIIIQDYIGQKEVIQGQYKYSHQDWRDLKENAAA